MNKPYLLLVLAFLGGVFKIIGGILYGSRALFVDALTSFANIVALLATIHFYRISSMPPDKDHPYGHYRLGYGGTMVSLITYGYVAGLASMELLYSTSYSIEYYSIYYALAGLATYGLVVYMAFRMGEYFKAYGLFTISELYESIVTVVAVVSGVLYSYLIDYIGAIGLTVYIFYELIQIGRKTLNIVSDQSAPRQVFEEVEKIFSSKGYRVIDLRIRCIAPNIYHGDTRIKADKNINAEEMKREIGEIKRFLRNKYNLDLVVELV